MIQLETHPPHTKPRTEQGMRISLDSMAASFTAAMIFSVLVTGIGSGGLGGSITGTGFS